MAEFRAALTQPKRLIPAKLERWAVTLALLIIAMLCLAPKSCAALDKFLSARLLALTTPRPAPTSTWTLYPSHTPVPPPTTAAPAPTSTWTAIPTIPPTPTLSPTPTITPPIPPGIETAQAGERWVSPQDGAALIFVPAGDFLMGSREDGSGAQADEKPLHRVTLDAYWIDQSEVTNAMFTRFSQATGYVTEAERQGKGFTFVEEAWQELAGADWRHPQGPGSNLDGMENHPVVLVSWNDATAYCAWAGRRLPSEAEWEKAGRGGLEGALYPWGDGDLASNLVNFADASLRTSWADPNVNDGWRLTAPAGSYPAGASSYGLLDMAGNVWEWVQDWYSEGYYTSAPPNNPGGPEAGFKRVMRGGGWSHAWSSLRLAARRGETPDSRSADVGFRCLLSVEK